MRHLLHVQQRFRAPSSCTMQAAHDGVRHIALRCSVCEPEFVASAHSFPAPVLDRTPVGAGAAHMSLLAFPTHAVLGADRRTQGLRSRAARRPPACAVLTTSSARAMRCSCAGADARVYSCVVVSGCVCATCVESGGDLGGICCVRLNLRTVVCGRSRVAVVWAIAIARRAPVHSRAGRCPAAPELPLRLRGAGRARVCVFWALHIALYGS